MMNLIDACKDHGIDDILQLPDVRERVDLYFEYEEKFKAQIKRCSTVYQNLVVLDLRNEETIYPGNRFMIYGLFPKCNISIHVIWGLKKQNTALAVGKSILNRTSNTNIGKLMLEYDGGGHESAGTCQIDNDKADQVLKELIEKITADG
jgi:nanoRNase/pAp phosphatase (c-di-AMP/oligoRNAs hydrolase)